MSLLEELLVATLGQVRTRTLFLQMEVPGAVAGIAMGPVPRSVLAQALNMALFEDLLARVPAGRDYVADVVTQGARVSFDHGAVRTVLWPSGALPPGEAAISRVLRPLGFRCADTYPLPRLKMTGRAWTHEDHPQSIAQFFVSELHPEKFTHEFQETVTRVLATSRDPLTARDIALLEQLSRDHQLPFTAATELLPALVRCFARQHGAVRLADYEALVRESSEMAWIATEGTAFNHVTDRVGDVDAVAHAQRLLGRPIKDTVEVSKSGRVRQTAFRAAEVEREFPIDDGLVTRRVPGSFYEFISRASDDGGVAGQVDLRFDAGNATGIFQMTAAA